MASPPAFAIAGVGVLVYLLLHSSPGFLDWDTYGRLRWISELRIDRSPDGHLLMHVILHRLVRLGLSAAQAVYAATAVGVGLLLAAGTYVGRARGLEGRALAVVVAALIVASPGVVALILMAEDNVTYLAPLLLFFHWLTAAPPDDGNRAAGVKAGGMLAIAMLLNITSLIFLFLAPLVPVLWGLRRRTDAVRLAVTLATALGVYYLAHLVLFSGAPIAMHEFLPQALRAEDFEQSTTPLGSQARFDLFLSGMRAIALTPTLHLMELSNWIVPLVRTWIPLAMLVSYGVLGMRAWRMVRDDEGGAAWSSLILTGGVAGLALLFPYFYEPALIERWDMLWLVLFLGLVGVVRSKPRGGAEVVLAGALLLQSIGTGLVVAHHVGRAYERPEETEMREDIADVTASGATPIVYPLSIDRLYVAYVVDRLPRRRMYLVGKDDGALTCIRVSPRLREVAVSCASVARHVHRAEEPFIDWRAASFFAPKEAPPSP